MFIADHDNPFAVVSFIPVDTAKKRERRVMVSATDSLIYKGKPTFDDSVEQIVVHKEVSGIGTNSFSINMVARVDESGYSWDQKIIPNDLVVIQMIRPKKDKQMKTVMLGLVQEVLRNTTMRGNQTNPTVNRHITIKGFDIVGILTHHTIFSSINYIIQYGNLPDSLKAIIPIHLDTFMLKRGESKDGGLSPRTISAFVTYLFDTYLTPSLGEAKIPAIGNASMIDLIDYSNLSKEKCFENLKIFGIDYMSLSGPSFAEFILQILQIPFNETVTRYTDFKSEDTISVNNIKSRFIVRSSPFKYDASIKGDTLNPVGGNICNTYEGNSHEITRWHITDEDVIEEKVGRSNHKTFNLFMTAPRSKMAIGMHPVLNIDPAYDRSKIERYGFKFNILPLDYFQVSTGSETLGKDGGGPQAKAAYDTTLASRLSNIYKQWYIRDNEFIKGEISIKGYASIREGDFLEYTSAEMNLKIEAYIESVDHVFVNFESFITKVIITRGAVSQLE